MKNGRKNRRVIAAGLGCILALSAPFSALADWEKQPDETWWYTKEDGTYLMDGFTKDGYYVDGTGVWRSSVEILNTRIPCKNYFLKAGQNKEWEKMTTVIGQLKTQLEEKVGEISQIRTYGDHLELVRVKDEKETVLFSLWQDAQTDGYLLKLATSLTKDKGETERLSWYDYQVLRAWLHCISRTGEMASQAIYSSWEEKNDYGLSFGQWVPVGDCEIQYSPADGMGYYYIRPREGLGVA